MGPMAEASDIVLPVAHWLELDDIYDMHPRFMIEAHNKVVEPPGEAKSDVWIFNEIGKASSAHNTGLKMLKPVWMTN